MRCPASPVMMVHPAMTSEPQALIAARAWMGTPYVLSAALRGVGCDCIGLVRGVWSDVTGKPAPAPPP